MAPGATDAHAVGMRVLDGVIMLGRIAIDCGQMLITVNRMNPRYSK